MYVCVVLRPPRVCHLLCPWCIFICKIIQYDDDDRHQSTLYWKFSQFMCRMLRSLQQLFVWCVPVPCVELCIFHRYNLTSINKSICNRFSTRLHTSSFLTGISVLLLYRLSNISFVPISILLAISRYPSIIIVNASCMNIRVGVLAIFRFRLGSTSLFRNSFTDSNSLN